MIPNSSSTTFCLPLLLLLMHTPFHLLFFFSLVNFSFNWPLAFLALFLRVQTMPLCCCFHLKSCVVSVWVQAVALCSPLLAFCSAFLPSCTLERTIPLLWDWKTLRSPAHLCFLRQFMMWCWKAGTWRGWKFIFLKPRIIILLSILLISLKFQNQYCRSCSKDIIIGNIHNKVNYCWELQLWKYYRYSKLVY